VNIRSGIRGNLQCEGTRNRRLVNRGRKEECVRKLMMQKQECGNGLGKVKNESSGRGLIRVGATPMKQTTSQGTNKPSNCGGWGNNKRRDSRVPRIVFDPEFEAIQ
jgi:hypothetical protein